MKNLNREEEKILIQLAQNGNFFAERKLTESFMGCIYGIALEHYQAMRTSLRDAVSLAVIGVHNAIMRFDSSYKVRLMTYAYWHILRVYYSQSMKRESSVDYRTNKRFIVTEKELRDNMINGESFDLGSMKDENSAADTLALQKSAEEYVKLLTEDMRDKEAVNKALSSYEVGENPNAKYLKKIKSAAFKRLEKMKSNSQLD